MRDSDAIHTLGKGYILQARAASCTLPLAVRKIVDHELDSIERLMREAQREGDEELLDEVQLRMLQVEKYLIPKNRQALKEPNPV